MVALSLDVKELYRLNGDGKLKAFADVAFGELLLVKGLRVVEGKKGLFVGMPRRQGKDGQWYPTITPLSEELKSQIDEAVLEAYQNQD